MNELIIKTQQPAKIEWDRDLFKSQIEEIAQRYEGTEVTEDNLADVKKDLATIRKIAKGTNQIALDIDKTLSAPIKAFRSEIKEDLQLLSSVEQEINGQVKAFEEKEKEAKRKEIEGLDHYTTFIKYYGFIDTWLNKTISLKQIQEEINSGIEMLNNNITLIKTNAATFNLEPDYYIELLETNDLTSVIKRMNEDYALVQRSKEEPKVEPIKSEPNETVRELTRVIIGTDSQLKALKQYADKIGVRIERV